MFKQSRRKIVAAIMSILMVIWMGTLCAIYIFSYNEVTTQNQEMLKEHLSQYRLNMSGIEDLFDMENLPDGENFLNMENQLEMENPPEMEHISGSGNFPGMPSQDPHFQDMPAFKLSTFYSVALNYQGEVLQIRNNDAGVYTDAELEELALKLLEGKKSSGIKNNLIFSIVDKGGYILIGFMDNTIMQEGMMTLFRYTLIFGAIVMIALYFLANYLARKIVEPLEESYEKQKQFISDAGHELKTPVSVVNANAELLSREIGDNQWLSNIQYENERMGKLIAQLLELARTENVSPQLEQIDFSRLVGGEVLPFESVAFESGTLLNTNIQNDIYIEGDSTQLKQLVSILTDNAIRHGAGGKEIRLSLIEERGFAKLSVINDGEEIPPEQRQKLFERFYRTDDVRNSKENHYGLGLAIAKAIATAHKGKIEVLCDQGKVEFIVLIPLHK